MIEFKKLFKNFQWKYYLGSCIIVSIFAFFVHVKDNSPPNFEVFIMWLPATWLLVFGMGFAFTLFIGGDD